MKVIALTSESFKVYTTVSKIAYIYSYCMPGALTSWSENELCAVRVFLCLYHPINHYVKLVTA
jgi:hypothetical protein